MFKAAVIGCGGIGSQLQFDPGAIKYGICTHAAAYDAHPDTHLVSLCDINEKHLKSAMEYWNVNQGYNDWSKLLIESDPDIVSICTPASTHYDIAVACIQSKSVKGVLLEKPVSETIEQAEELQSMFENSGIKVLINYRRRFLKPLKSLKHLINKKDFGNPILVRGVYTKGLVHNGSHWIDLLRYYFGEPNWLQAENRLQDESNDPGLDVVFGFNSGLQAQLLAFKSDHYTVFEMDIFLSDGYIRITEGSDTMYVHKVLNNYPFKGYRALGPAELESHYMYNWMSEVVNNLVDSVNSGADPICTIYDGIQDQKIANIARLSLNDNKVQNNMNMVVL
ncbi:Gfo/Idh/MocA family oxidoreductase [bacterium]|jgi:predicted dehydrogenase|nr:Gfo/Idh/MocA family oxidoreductase [bacterium]